jgi:hypothetical protein
MQTRSRVDESAAGRTANLPLPLSAAVAAAGAQSLVKSPLRHTQPQRWGGGLQLNGMTFLRVKTWAAPAVCVLAQLA